MQPSHNQPANLRQRLVIPACYATMAMLGVTISLLGPSLPALAARMQVALPQAGALFTFFATGSVIATLLVARLNDRPIRHLVLIIGALGMAAGHWLLAAGDTLLQAGLAVTLSGLAMSAVGTGPNAIIADLYRGRAGQALNALHIAAGVGAFVGPLMLGMALRLGGDYRSVYRLAAFSMLAVAAIWAFSKPPLPERGAQQARVSLKWLAPLLLVFVFTMLYTGTETAIGGWLFTYARDAIHQNAPTASLAASLLWLAILLGRLTAVHVLRHLSSIAMLRLCVAGGMAGLAAILLGQAWGSFFWAGVAITGFCFGPVFPTALALSSELAPRQAGAASSLVVASGSVGAMVLPWSAGALIPYIGITGSLTAGFLPLGLMLICLWAIHRRQQPHKYA